MDKKRSFLAAIFLLLVCFVTYGDILTHQFMIDERVYVRTQYAEQLIVLRPQDTIFGYYRTFGDYFTKPKWMGHHYNPLNHLLNVSLFRTFQTPFPLYLINLLLFYADLLLLFFFVYFISRDVLTALLTSGLFCIHPMTGEMLQHITLNITFLQMIFMEAALISLYLYVRQSKPVFYYFFSLVMALLALLCLETALLLPLYAAALLFFLTDLKPHKIIKLIFPYLFLSLGLAVLWLLVINPSVHLESIQALHFGHWWAMSANFAHMFFWYLGNLFVPQDIVFMANKPLLEGHLWLWNLAFFGFWVGCGLMICYFLKRSLETFALVLFLGGFIFTVPASQAWGSMGVVFEPNWLYFSSVGFYLFAVMLILKLRKKVHWFLWATLLCVLFVSYCMATINLTVRARTEIGYAQNWLRLFPGNSIAMEIVASYYKNHPGFSIPSDLVPDMMDLADAFIKDNSPVSLELLERISSGRLSSQQQKQLMYRWAAYQCKYGHRVQCREDVKHLMGPSPDPYASMQLAYEFYKTGADAPAVNLLEQCIALYPKYKEPYLLLGVVLGNEGRYKESLGWWREGMALDPADPRFMADITQAQRLYRDEPAASTR